MLKISYSAIYVIVAKTYASVNNPCMNIHYYAMNFHHNLKVVHTIEGCKPVIKHGYNIFNYIQIYQVGHLS